MQIAASIAVLFLVTVIAVQLAVARRFRGRGLELAARLHDSPRMRDAEASLPQIVADFARRSGAEPSAVSRIVRFRQEGELRLRQGGPFSRFTAWQMVALGRAGFVWAARQNIKAVPAVQIIDSYVGGAGCLEARLFGSILLAHAEGAEISLGEAYRYLAELPWAPDVILGNPDLEWRVTARNIVEARLATADGIARVSFRFNSDGDVVEMSAENRPALDADGRSRLLGWRGTFSDYRQIGPRRVPARGEVGYVYPSGYETYFRGRITDYSVSA